MLALDIRRKTNLTISFDAGGQTIVVKLIVKTERKDPFEALQKRPFVLTHDHEPDTVVDDFLRHRHEPNTHIFYSRVRDKAAFGTHQRGAFHDDPVPPILGALAEETDLQFFDPIE